MIAALTGQLREKQPTSVILDVNGVGYAVMVSLVTYQELPDVGESVSLLIHTNVREDDIILFGFYEPHEKQLFQKLIKVNGVGPRLALNILSGISTNELIQALRLEDTVRITSIPGIGKKTAERIVLDLKDKLAEMHVVSPHSETHQPKKRELRDDLLSVLLNLGYKRGMAERALRDIDLNEVTSLKDAVRLTLRSLADQNQKQVS